MVQLIRLTVRQYTTHIRQEAVGVDSDSKGAISSNPCRHLVLILWQVHVAGDCRTNLVFACRACGCLARARDVGIAVLLVHFAAVRVHKPLEGVVHQTAIAAVVHGVTGHKQLFRQACQLVAGHVPLPLDAANGGEGPARAAAALVLHWRHGALRAPVHLRGRTPGRHLHWCPQTPPRHLEVRLTIDVALTELLTREVRETCHAEHCVRVRLRLQLRKRKVLLEHAQAVRLLSSVPVHLAVLLLEGRKLRCQSVVCTHACHRSGNGAQDDGQSSQRHQGVVHLHGVGLYVRLLSSSSYLVPLQYKCLDLTIRKGKTNKEIQKEAGKQQAMQGVTHRRAAPRQEEPHGVTQRSTGRPYIYKHMKDTRVAETDIALKILPIRYSTHFILLKNPSHFALFAPLT
ncbi:hypothetical protein LSM04_000018 [Trypanosoma melophagium]|uniref:uncharacterized protein n=1 Tax=Trypanosoma melophagium TaxID=715481 RepID=UPI00351A8937|nr:hypothetical protein LSM04_000018 [Trypanosoma melophagium]